MSLHTCATRDPASQAAGPPSRSILPGAELPRPKKSLVFMHARSLRSCLTLGNPVDRGLPGFSVSEGILQARTLERIGQCWLPHPSRALYFLPPYLPTPLSTWCCQNCCDPSSCTASHPALTGANPSPPGHPQEQTPVDDPRVEGEIKPQRRPKTFPPVVQAADEIHTIN